MERRDVEARDGWQARVEARGFPLHTADGPYWDETACYAFTAAEIAVVERATAELHARTLEAVEHVITSGRWWDRLRIPPALVPLVRASWEACEGQGAPSLYGRMDLAWTGEGPPRLLEYNADTPTALIEAAVVQWDWLQDAFPGKDQLNSLHERLVAGWKDLAPWLAAGPVHFTCMDTPEDVLTTTYLQDTAAQAGLRTVFLRIEEVGWDGRGFVDLADRPILTCFKLYPWEWMAREAFGEHLAAGGTSWIEPAWKAVVSNKAFLAVLHELFPGHPNLLRATLDEPAPGLRSYARKPILGREGADVTLVRDGEVLAQGAPGGYGAEGYVYQALYPFDDRFGGRTPVLGSWVVQGEPAGLGIREDASPITGNTSRFIPHLID
ncbi:MAG TPA: glutathionylspermidine synthase family protein [Anaeromyxobacteraceae bacterium]|nr:glutathionylspermidine synthase family protein [Anaeromyxobacteraceae bacterium]